METFGGSSTGAHRDLNYTVWSWVAGLRQGGASMPTLHPMKQVICTVALLLSAPTVWAQTAFIRGLVSDITEEPISGVTVTAESAEWRRMEEEATDGAGRFQFIGLQGGRWLFVVRKRGYEPSQGFATVRNNRFPPATSLSNQGTSSSQSMGMRFLAAQTWPAF